MKFTSIPTINYNISNINILSNKNEEISRKRENERKHKHSLRLGKLSTKSYKLIVYIYMARDLDAADNDGFSDPFLEVSYCGKNERTEIIRKTLNPTWQQALSLTIDVPQPTQYAPPIHFVIYDWDRFSSNDQIYMIFGQRISLRSIVVSKSFDLFFWFSYQFYQTLQNPRQLKIIGKIRVKWVD